MQKRDVIFESFKNISYLLDTMEKRQVNSVFLSKKDDLSSQRDETNNKKKFSGVNTYKEAMDIMEKGYSDPLQKMKREIIKVGRSDTTKKPRLKNDFVGFVPNVPNTLKNIPLTMINREKAAVKKTKTIHLTYSFCASANIKPDAIIKAGVNFISLVNSLEKQGYRAKIDVIFIAMSNRTAAGYTVTLKEYGQQLNLLKLAFPLIHPAMLRRVSFKWLETKPDLVDKEFLHGYGMPFGLMVGQSYERKWLKDNGLLTGENSYYVSLSEASAGNNIQELAKRIGLVI